MNVFKMTVWLKKRYFFEKKMTLIGGKNSFLVLTVVTYMAIKTMLEYYKYILTTLFNHLLLRYLKMNNQFLTRQSLGEFLFLLFRFFLLSFFLSSFCLLVLLSTFYLDQTFPKSFQLGLAWLSLTQLDST